MKLAKNIIFVIMLCLFSYLYIPLNYDTEFINLYNGINFNSRIYYYLVQFFLFSCYSLFIYNEFETYIYQYGLHVVLREQSRNKMIFRLTIKLLFFILWLEFIKIISYICCMLIMRGKITLSHPFEVLKIFFLHLFVYLLILFIQMMLEIFISGKLALCVILSYFLLSISLSDIIYESDFMAKTLNLILLPNLSMKLRLDDLISDEYLYFIVFAFLILIMFVTYRLSQYFFSRKDILQSD